MISGSKIDQSLRERRGILHLLEGVNRDNITVGEMEEIGKTLRKAGNRALNPLVRRLWKEKNGELLSKYAYLLDFFEEGGWLDELVRILLKRRDLEREAKSALLAALSSYGIDIGSPPFDRILQEAGGPLRVTLPKILDRGEPGLLAFMENFVDYHEEIRIAMVREIPRVADPRAVSLLEALAGFDEGGVAAEALTGLGRVRSPRAAELLRLCTLHGDPALRPVAEKGLRRLAFLGIRPQPFSEYLPFGTARVTPYDGSGSRNLWLWRGRVDEKVDMLFLQLHEERGIIDAVSYGGLEESELAELLAEAAEQEPLVEIAADYALLLLRDALHACGASCTLLPAEFFLRRGMFRDCDITPLPYDPADPLQRLREDAVDPEEAFPALLDEDLFSGWVVSSSPVYDLAEEWSRLGERGRERSREGRALLERLCREVLQPEKERIVRRLLFTADLIRLSGGERSLLADTAGCARSISSSTRPLHLHPFLRRMALESLEVAVEAMAEGYDPRKEFDDE